jgi:hypothetical protein
MAGELPLNGQHTKIRILVGTNPPFGEDIVLKWTIKERVTKYNDAHVGELNDKNDKQRDGWSVDLELQHATSALMDALETQYALREANLPFDPIAIQLQLNERLGNIKAYLFTNITTEEELGSGGRKDRLNYKLSCDAERRELVR